MIKFFIMYWKTTLLLSHPGLGPTLAELLFFFGFFINSKIYLWFFFNWNIHPPLLFRSALMAPCVLRITSCYHSLYFQHRTCVSTHYTIFSHFPPSHPIISSTVSGLPQLQFIGIRWSFVFKILGALPMRFFGNC